MIVSCGIILHRNGQYLIGHATGHGPTDSWTIFKGMRDPGETDKQAALREFLEETSIDLSALGLEITLYDAYHMKYKNKLVKVFMCDDDNEVTANIKPRCNSFVRPNYPEIDDFAWVTKEEAYKRVFDSQKFLFKP